MDRDEAIREALIDACQDIYDDSEQKFLDSLDASGFVVVPREAFESAIAGYEEGTAYKGDYLTTKHGDKEEIARLRAMLAAAKDD